MLKTASTTTTPGVSAYDEVPTAYDPIPPAQSGFGGMGPDLQNSLVEVRHDLKILIIQKMMIK